MDRKRYHYIDVAKALGIFSIYLGHFAHAAGLAYHFVFAFHVPLFFFVSGCTDTLSREKSALLRIKRRIGTILVPYFFFAISGLVFYALEINASSDAMSDQLRFALQGAVRNTFIVNQLWFLTCLFTTCVLFEVVRLLRYRWLIMPACVIIHVVAQTMLPNNPTVAPSWYYNVDSALYYLVFYAAGYAAFPAIAKFLDRCEGGKMVPNLILGVLGLCALFYGLQVYDQKNPLEMWSAAPGYLELYPTIQAFILIWLTVTIGYYLRNYTQLQEIGKASLYLCGSEMFIRDMLNQVLGTVGLSWAPATPLASVLCTLILLYLAWKLLCPIEIRCVQKIRSVLRV